MSRVGHPDQELQYLKVDVLIELLACGAAYYDVVSSKELETLILSIGDAMLGIATDKLWGIGLPAKPRR